MSQNNRAERLKQTDQYKRDYEHANTELGLRAMCLRTVDTDPQQLRQFVAAGIKLAKVCEHQYATESPLNVLFWLANKLQLECAKPCRSCIYLEACQSEEEQVKRCIRSVCQEFGEGKVVPFLAPSPQQQAYI